MRAGALIGTANAISGDGAATAIGGGAEGTGGAVRGGGCRRFGVGGSSGDGDESAANSSTFRISAVIGGGSCAGGAGRAYAHTAPARPTNKHPDQITSVRTGIKLSVSLATVTLGVGENGKEPFRGTGRTGSCVAAIITSLSIPKPVWRRSILAASSAGIS